MRKKRSFMLSFAAVMLFSALALLTACKGKAPVLNVDAEEYEATAKAAVHYVLPSATAVSQNGGEAEVEIVGVDPDGASVAIDGFTATISKLGLHTFTYTATEGELRSESVVYKVTFTAPDKPVIYLAASGTEATYRQAKGIEVPSASALSESDDNVTVSVSGKAPDGSAVTITDGKFDALTVGDYVFTYTAADVFGTAADPVVYTVHVTEYLLTMEVAETQLSVEGAKDIALPQAEVISSVDNELEATVTVKSAPSGSAFAAGNAVTGFAFTPDVAGTYVFSYVAVDSMQHSTPTVDVTVNVRYGEPTMAFSESFPATLDEGEKYEIPTFAEMGGSVAYDWLDYGTADFNVTTKVYFTLLGETEKTEVENIAEAIDLKAGKLEIVYTATMKTNAEITGSKTVLISVSNTAFDVLRTGNHIAQMRYREGIYDKSYLEITTTASWGGITLAEDALKAFIAQDGGYIRYLIYNPNAKTTRMVFQHRGVQDGAERYGAVGTEYNSGSKLWEINLVFQMPAYGYREVIIPRAYLGDNCNTVSLWTNNSGDKFAVLDFEILTDEEFVGTAAYDFSKGLPVLTNEDGEAVSDGSATIEKVTYGEDANAIKITNSGSGSVYADLFGDTVDKTVVKSIFSAADRGQKDAVLTFTATNTGTEAVQYKVIVGENVFYTLEVVPEYDEYNEPTGGTTTATPVLQPGESRRIEIAYSAMIGDAAGDFTAKLAIIGAGELTYSGFTLREGSFEGYNPTAENVQPQLNVEKTADWQDTVTLEPGMTYTVPVKVTYRTFYDSDTLTATVTDPRNEKTALVDGKFEPVYTGTYTVTYTLTDSMGNKVEKSVSVEFTTDRPIVTVEGGKYEFETEFDRSYKLPAAIVLNGDGMEVSIAGTDPDGNSVTVGSDRTFDAGKEGTYVFVYSVAAEGSISASIEVNVKPGNVTFDFNSMEMPSIIPDHTSFTVPDITKGEFFVLEYNGWTADDFNITQSAYFTTDAEGESGTEITVGESGKYEIGYIKIRYEGVAKENLNGKSFSFVKKFTVQVGTVFTTFSSAGSGLAGGSSTAAAVKPENAPSYVPITPTHNGSSGIDINTSGSPEIEKFMAADDGYLVMWIYNEKDFTYKVFFGSYVKNATATKPGYTNTGSRWEYQLAVQMPANGYRKLVIPRTEIDDNHTNFSMWAIETDTGSGKITTKPVTWRIYDFRYVDEAAADKLGITFADLPTAQSGTVTAYENGFKLSGGSVDLANNAALADFMKNTAKADQEAYILQFAITNTGDAAVTVEISSETSAKKYGTEEVLTKAIHLLPTEVTLAAGETRIITIINEQIYDLLRRNIEESRPEITKFAFSVEGEVAIYDFTLTSVPVFESTVS